MAKAARWKAGFGLAATSEGKGNRERAFSGSRAGNPHLGLLQTAPKQARAGHSPAQPSPARPPPSAGVLAGRRSVGGRRGHRGPSGPAGSERDSSVCSSARCHHPPAPRRATGPGASPRAAGALSPTCGPRRAGLLRDGEWVPGGPFQARRRRRRPALLLCPSGRLGRRAALAPASARLLGGPLAQDVLDEERGQPLGSERGGSAACLRHGRLHGPRLCPGRPAPRPAAGVGLSRSLRTRPGRPF